MPFHNFSPYKRFYYSHFDCSPKRLFVWGAIYQTKRKKQHGKRRRQSKYFTLHFSPKYPRKRLLGEDRIRLLNNNITSINTLHYNMTSANKLYSNSTSIDKLHNNMILTDKKVGIKIVKNCSLSIYVHIYIHLFISIYNSISVSLCLYCLIVGWYSS